MPVGLTPTGKGVYPDVAQSGVADEQLSPAELGARVAQHHASLASEFQPRSHLERILICQTARHAGALDLAADCEISALRVASNSIGAANLLPGAIGPDAQRVAAANSHILQSVARYRVGHERGLYQSIRLIRDLRHDPRHAEPLPLFPDENACEAYLYQWQRGQRWSCPECGDERRYWLAGRGKYECACGRQYSVRYHTVYYQSRAPLMTWFAVVAHLVVDPSVTTSTLAQTLNVLRRATIRAMITKVLAALESAHPGQLLADVDALVMQQLYLPQALRENTTSQQPARRSAEP